MAARPDTLIFLTFTAPGRVRHRHGGGWCPCTPEGGVDLAEWNGSHGRAWNRLVTDLRRHEVLGPRIEFFKATEVQKRGALHLHVLARLVAPVELPAKGLEALIRPWAIRHGFGHEVAVRVASSAGQSARLMAWYCAKYVSKAAVSRDVVPWPRAVVVGSDVVARSCPRTYRTWSASRWWGSSMRAVSDGRRRWHRGEYSGELPLDRVLDLGSFFPAIRQSPNLAGAVPGQGPPWAGP